MMVRLSILTSFAIAATLLTAPLQARAQTPAQNNAARALFVEGRDFWDDGKFSEAERKFREALGRYPKAERSDRTSFYLITTLIKLGKTSQARAEIESFRRTYPNSTWSSDVEEKRLALGGLSVPTPVFGGYRIVGPVPNPKNPKNPGIPQPVALPRPAPVNVTMDINTNAALEQEVLRQIVEKNPNHGIQIARDRIRGNPSDPVVISNLPTIAVSRSPQAMPFLFMLAGSGTSSPNTRSQAVFWITRSSDKDSVGKVVVEMMKQKDSIVVVVDVLNRFSPGDQRTAIDQIAQHPGPERVPALESIFRNSTNLMLRTQIVNSVGSIPEPAALNFLTNVVKHERQVPVRQAAIHSLVSRKDTRVETLDEILKTLTESPPNK